MNLKYTLGMVLLVFLSTALWAYQPFQDKPEFFLEHLKKTSYSIDSKANAVVLYEVGTSTLTMDIDHSWKITRSVRRVIKILSAKGMDEANVAVRFYNKNHKYFTNVEGKTYNLENGNLKVSKVDKHAVTTEAVNTAGNSAALGKFSMPAVKEGSVIDYTYELDEDFNFVFADWNFQDEIPVLYSELCAVFNSNLRVAAATRTSRDFIVYDTDVAKVPDSLVPLAYTSASHSTFAAANTIKRWVRRNINGYTEEPYVYNVANYLEGIELQASGFNNLGYDVLDNSTWDGFNNFIREEIKKFGNHGKNRDADDLAITLADNEKDSLLIAKKIYNYVKDSFIALSGSSFKIGTFRKVLESRNGSAIDINLFLIELLNAAGFRSNLVLSGSRNDFKLPKELPILDRVDHAICQVIIDGIPYYLEANEKYNAFGVLPDEYYSGFAWVVDKKGYSINLDPSMCRNKNVIVVRSENTDISNYTIRVKENIGALQAGDKRKEWIKDSSAIRKDIYTHVKGFSGDVELMSYAVHGLTHTDSILQVEYVVKTNWDSNATLYIVPSLYNYFTENPFKTANRQFPVEWPSATEFVYSLVLRLPDHYAIDEVTPSINYKLDDMDTYKYLIEYDKETNSLMLNTKLTMLKTYFDIDVYPDLKEFFNKIIAQQKKPCLIKKRA